MQHGAHLHSLKLLQLGLSTRPGVLHCAHSESRRPRAPCPLLKWAASHCDERATIRHDVILRRVALAAFVVAWPDGGVKAADGRQFAATRERQSATADGRLAPGAESFEHI